MFGRPRRIFSQQATKRQVSPQCRSKPSINANLFSLRSACDTVAHYITRDQRASGSAIDRSIRLSNTSQPRRRALCLLSLSLSLSALPGEETPPFLALLDRGERVASYAMRCVALHASYTILHHHQRVTRSTTGALLREYLQVYGTLSIVRSLYHTIQVSRRTPQFTAPESGRATIMARGEHQARHRS
eukprot:958432-Pleurochrysis_carterae.AAC.5